MNAARPIFTDPARQQEFDTNGWTKLQLFDEADVQHLRELYFSLGKMENGRGGFYVGLDSADKQQVKNVRESIRRLFLEKAGHHFDRVRIFTASFVAKEPNPMGVVPPHQDWSFTDEPSFSSATVWIALQDTNVENGGLGFINGSHRFFNTPRASPSPQAKSLISDHLYTLFPWLDVKTLKPGEGLIFHNSTIHGSPPNTSTEMRIAAGIGISQAEAPLLHYYQSPGLSPAETLCLEVDEDFFLKYNNTYLSEIYQKGESPVGYVVKSRAVREPEQFTSAQILDMVQAIPGNRYNGALVDKMQKIYAPKAAASEPVENNAAPGNVQKREKVYTLKNIIAEIRYRLGKIGI